MSDALPLMAGKKGLIMGIANERSLAWGIAKTVAAHGAELAVTYQGEVMEKRVRPLAEQLRASLIMPADVTDPASLDALFATVAEDWRRLDFLVHAIAFADKEELKGKYLDTSPDNFQRTMMISCYSFTELCRRAAPLMTAGGSLLTLTYLGAERVTPHYNVMGVAKAALEASVRYLAVDLGGAGVPGQRHLRRPDQDARGLGHRRLPLHPEVERVQFAAQAQHHDRGRRRRGVVSALRPRRRHHRRDPARQLRLPRGRHEGGRRPGHFGRLIERTIGDAGDGG